MKTINKIKLLTGLMLVLTNSAWAQVCPTPVMNGTTQEVSITGGKLSLQPLPAGNGMKLMVQMQGLVSSETETQEATIYTDGSGAPSATITVNKYYYDQATYQLKGEIIAVLGALYNASTGQIDIGYGSKADNFLQVIQGSSLSCIPYPNATGFGVATHELTLIDVTIVDVATGVQALNGLLNQCNADKVALQNSLTMTQSALSQCELDKATLQQTIANQAAQITALQAELALKNARISELEALVASLRAQLAALSAQSSNRAVYDLSKAISQLRKTTKFALEQSRLSKIEKRMKRMSAIAKLAKKANAANIQQGDTKVSVTSSTVQ